MASMQKLIAIGNLGKDPETRYMANGDAVANFSMAVTRTWKSKDGEKQEETEWLRCSCFGKLAEIAGEYLLKGSQLAIVGRLRTRKWQNKEGVDQYTTEIIVEEFTMLGGKPRGDRDDDDDRRPARKADDAAPRRAPAAQSKPAKTLAQGGSGFDDMEDDIPF